MLYCVCAGNGKFHSLMHKLYFCEYNYLIDESALCLHCMCYNCLQTTFLCCYCRTLFLRICSKND